MAQSSTKLRFTESLLRRPKKEEVRSRKYLQPDEVERLIDAAELPFLHLT